jgi:hypothetical protein
MRRCLFALAGGLALLASPGLGQAAPRVEADPANEYRVTPEAGPWLVIVKSYKGPQAAQMAHDLILLVRQRDNLPAYLFVHGEEERRKQQEYVQKMHELCPDVKDLRIRVVRVEEEFAVLVGGYPDIDAARKALDGVKRLKPPDDDRLMDKVTSVGPVAEGETRAVIKAAPVNPFVTAFVVHNPTVPQEAVDHNKADPALKDLNAGRPYNLLGCGHPWTLVVKDFQGAAVLQPQSSTGSFLGMLGLGSKSQDVLAASGLQAEEVARVLRELKFDAYVLHTRTSSIVSVGGFDAPDDPQLQQLQRQLANLQLGPVQCFARPMPMQVPKF